MSSAKYVWAVACLIASSSAYGTETDLIGVYWFPDKDGQVQITREGDTYVGTVIAYDIPDQLDENNPDPKLRTQPFVGSRMFADFSYNEGAERWDGGTIYDGSSGKTYKCRLWFEDGDLSVLNARGYVGAPMFGRNETFLRVDAHED